MRDFKTTLFLVAVLLGTPALATSGVAVFHLASDGLSPHTAAAAATTPDTASAAAAPIASAVAPTALTLGTQTHFSQGWPVSSLALASQVSAPLLRDSVPWPAGEPVHGTYALTGGKVQALLNACAAGQRLILTEVATNPLYDGGKWVASAQGVAAFANYLGALKARFGTCLAAIELGNEINAPSNLSFAAGVNPLKGYVAIAGAAHAALSGHPALLGGSTNMIGTGFLKTLFAAGMLPVVDGLAVHPYRTRGEGLDVELASLNAAMAAAGRVVPVWASEFDPTLSDQHTAAGELFKQATLMAASGVPVAAWYALVNEPAFPTMGLFAGTTIKDQGKAFAWYQQAITPLGAPQRIDLGDPLIYAWRYGQATTIIWGAPRGLTLWDGTTARAADGTPLPNPTVGEEPIIISGTSFSLGQSAVVADTLLGWGGSGWRYFARSASGADVALTLIDDTWSSYFGTRWTRPLRIGPTTAAVAGTGAAPVQAVWRYVSPVAQSVDLGLCLAKAAVGDGVDVTITRNGNPLWRTILTSQSAASVSTLDLIAGDRIDLVIGPNQTAGGDAFSYRMILFRHGQAGVVPCPPLNG